MALFGPVAASHGRIVLITLRAVSFWRGEAGDWPRWDGVGDGVEMALGLGIVWGFWESVPRDSGAERVVPKGSYYYFSLGKG